MRQRNIKNLDQKIRRNSTFLVTDPESCRGRWREVFGNNAPVYLEIGCGKGKFIASRAEAFPDRNFIAIEGQSNVALRALQKAETCHFDNLRIFIDYVDDLGRYFEPGEMAGIYLNFSDPWPKARHAKRRLTYREKLKNYRSVMSPEGTIEFKTDNDGLFAFTIDEIRNAGFSIWEMTTDLAASTFESKLFTTEYEERFGSAGKNINYVKFK